MLRGKCAPLSAISLQQAACRWKAGQAPRFFPCCSHFPPPPLMPAHMVKLMCVQCEEGGTPLMAVRPQSPGKEGPMRRLPSAIQGTGEAHPGHRCNEPPGAVPSRPPLGSRLLPNACESPAPRGQASESHLGRPARGKSTGFLSSHVSGLICRLMARADPRCVNPTELATQCLGRKQHIQTQDSSYPFRMSPSSVKDPFLPSRNTC